MDALKLAGGTVVAGIWRVAAVVLAGLLLVVGTGAGTGWWLAAVARDDALASLEIQRGAVAALRAGVDLQNNRIVQLGEETLAAEARGKAAQALAAANGRRFDNALAGLAGARATTCDEAMPAVNQLLETVR